MCRANFTSKSHFFTTHTAMMIKYVDIICIVRYSSGMGDIDQAAVMAGVGGGCYLSLKTQVRVFIFCR